MSASPSRRVALAIDALRHGWPLRIVGTSGALLLLPAETAPHDARADRMLLSAARARTLHLTNQREAAEPDTPVIIEGARPFTLADARDLADPARDLAVPLKGPFRAVALDAEDSATGAMLLARHAGILPAFLIGPQPAGEAMEVATADLAHWSQTANLRIAARAHLPIASAEGAQIVAFRATDDLREHIALIIGEQTGDRVPLVRLHSECLTGDVLGSLKCDCGPQLDTALGAMAAEARAGGFGILLYLRQEGRGIGLINKLRAYQLQDQGFDTIDANTRLGLPAESRDFATAARMLALLNVARVRLLTNNPAKVDALAAAGIEIAERVPHSLLSNPHNHRYLATKRDRAGHLLD